MLAIVALAAVGLATVALRTQHLLAIADPGLVSTPAIASLQPIRAVLLLVGFVAVSALAVLGTRWLSRSRSLLEVLLGTPVRGGRPRRWSARWWSPLVRPVAPDRDAWRAPDRVGSGRVGATAVVAAGVPGIALVAVGWLLEVVAGSASDAARAALATAAGLILAALAALLAIPVLRKIQRREVVALRNVVDDALPIARHRPLGTYAVLLPVAIAAALGAASDDGHGCTVEGARCIELVVPADRTTGDARGPTLTVRYVVYAARSDDPRLLVVAVGGPGVGGIDDAPGILTGLDDRIRQQFDIVFYDARGVGASGGRHCRAATSAYDRQPAGDVEAARTFVDQCLREGHVDPAELAWYRTDQVVGDLDALRAHLGYERMVVYGQSYGTEVAQRYGMTYPDRVDTLILDGPVDLDLTAHEFWREAVHGFDAVLARTFDACRGDQACRTDLPDPEAAWERAMSRLSFADVRRIDVPAPRGGTQSYEVTADQFQAAVQAAMYTETGRSLVLRALAAVARGEWEPVARLAGDGSEYSVVESAFGYHAYTCADKPYATPRGVAGYLDQAHDAGIDDARLGDVYFVGLPCLFWPVEPLPDRPGLSNSPFPVIVLTSTGDPITTSSAARAIVARQPRAFLVETDGGPHVTFGNGDPCVDRVVVNWLVDQAEPRAVTSCSGDFTAPYEPLTARRVVEFPRAVDAAAAIETELWGAPELYWWDGASDLEIGCRAGGGMRVTADPATVRINLFDCAWAIGLPLDGDGTIALDTGRLELHLVGPRTDAVFVSDLEGRRLEGRWDGREITERG